MSPRRKIVSSRTWWLLLAAVFLGLNALLIARSTESSKGGALQANAIGFSFR